MTIKIILNDSEIGTMTINDVISIFYNPRSNMIIFHGVGFEKTFSRSDIKSFTFER